MADGFLPDSGHHGLHHRSGRRVDRVESVRHARVFRAPLRPGVVVADSEDDGGPRARRGPGARDAGDDLRLRVESPEHLRHTRPVCVAALPAADHRQGIAGTVSSARLAFEARAAPVRRSPASGPSRHSEALAGARLGWAVVDHFRGRDAELGRPRRALQGRKFSARDPGGSADRPACRHRHAPRDAERASADRTGRCDPDRPRSHSRACARRADRRATPRRSPTACASIVCDGRREWQRAE